MKCEKFRHLSLLARVSGCGSCKGDDVAQMTGLSRCSVSRGLQPAKTFRSDREYM
ncbi:hypothetical protein DPMN_045489 [Dreissena polymorpha]|uniref:Uncharacterized protein n=1 Tax=Dreissena polymorpha TaxID=45954 RepID=A0A9D4D6N0_DREPO|nr:hypothetical protein DPMN_045489 [Dreissena polymorpha]